VSGWEAGIRTLFAAISKLMTAWHFWQQVPMNHQLPVVGPSARFPSIPPESTSVVATSWQLIRDGIDCCRRRSFCADAIG
jgi:hypothetical protein